ncbi:hypothetical protein GE21DRAFT_9652 [Neurospora crassa]|uniref:Uncharacterized protein n=1 Tax=Neurospora crassa (strain ATCC 24698 / 74-OR23-1A / CBS 708.71 / DSM 1257 / FGSC 987) TaxID=367110 RepID=V5IKR1_NEUCR|nr:hypothetical protein NCU12057 [Neurospora crassa OR74A]ESA41800.1 hypothetical protein NCU12057 [Neurospora crassa OR74A]KHE80382.1 hypothetical protein GE21DRAFT_9652 [Neurospora crassa]|eukprot:XP_011395339.1 hypothetical protein NCU12057 [Neurospora crassa OR74A]
MSAISMLQQYLASIDVLSERAMPTSAPEPIEARPSRTLIDGAIGARTSDKYGAESISTMRATRHDIYLPTFNPLVRPTSTASFQVCTCSVLNEKSDCKDPACLDPIYSNSFADSSSIPASDIKYEGTRQCGLYDWTEPQPRNLLLIRRRQRGPPGFLISIANAPRS